MSHPMSQHEAIVQSILDRNDHHQPPAMAIYRTRAELIDEWAQEWDRETAEYMAPAQGAFAIEYADDAGIYGTGDTPDAAWREALEYLTDTPDVALLDLAIERSRWIDDAAKPQARAAARAMAAA